jgi:hypothetical protein
MTARPIEGRVALEKSNCRFAVFSCTSTAPNKKRRLKPFKHGHGRQERLQSSFLLD